MTVFLYDTKRRVELTLRETGGSNNWNLPMNSNDFRVFKDVQNAIEFVVRNTDRKPINMIGRSATLHMYDQRTSKLLWTAPMKVINDAKGICKIIIAPDVMEDWNLGSYSYSVSVTNSDGSVHMLYTDQSESQRGFFELAQGPIFDPTPSTEIRYADLTTVDREVDTQLTSFRKSSALPGSMQRDSTSGLHTILAHLNNFSGTLSIQGSVEDGTPGENDWYDIHVETFDHSSEVFPYTFTANLMWVRFWVYNRYEQLEDDTLVLPADKGDITKLVFRN